jgi:hypothetical protein
MNRMFQVIVAGGISLTGYACGSNVEVATQAGGTGSAAGTGGATPTGGVGGFPQTSGAGVGAFPQEGPPPFDAGMNSGDASSFCFPPDETDMVHPCPDGSILMDAAM